MQPTSNNPRYIVGCMTGTSLDGLDVALVRVEGSGLGMRATHLAAAAADLGDLAGKLRYFATGQPAPPIDYLRAARQLGELHATTVAQLLDEHLPCDAALDFVVAHGQTIWHAPDEHLTWQLFDPWPLVRRLRVPVCYDLRQADIIAGGQGAPITPLADWVLFHHPQRRRLIVNLGGICNVTLVAADHQATRGRDLFPCNILLDGIIRTRQPNLRYDVGGALASQGSVHPQVGAFIRAHPFFTEFDRPRSTGREAFDDAWLAQLDADFSTLSDADLLASAADAIARAIAGEAKQRRIDDLILAGGGAHNDALVARIRKHASDANVMMSDALDVPIASREAMGFTVLGALSRDGVVITLEEVTGAKSQGLSGAWVYP